MLNIPGIQLNNTIAEAILEKKGKEIFEFDLSDFEYVICQNFFICHADSSTQVNAIANNIEFRVKEKLNQKVNHREGQENCKWVLLDYGNVTIHIFDREYREYYKLEELWADANIRKIEEENVLK
ncbi:MAG: ribosome silencing factor [Bacteroidetes bacterium]|jgi:ribosome-associated protein|nr:ribosome silencing factor [Bacteroidota bacterium]